ncbi:hypothetical protein ACVIHI_008177 [Bradyrhizobium sp. USDA 4524]|nr:hypothetical protein [Bradyrhizobium sp. USDA 4538]MCP1899471.1 hypothetical protein [Bradyrhizobium sp. USDA 4537]MCP1986418.1 hypothetical protein [Bradyrhizobium sp. USDA 4539]
MSLSRAWTVRVAPLRSAAFNREKACSVGRVGRQITHAGADSLDRLADTGDLVSAQVVHEDDVALAQGRRQDLLDISQERGPIHCTVDDIGRREAIDAQRGDKRQRLPVTMGHARDEALTARRAPIVPDHLRRDRSLVDKDEARCTQLGLLGFQRGTLGSDVRSILLGGVQCFF